MKTKENNNSFIRSSVLSKQQRSTAKKKPNTTLYFVSSTKTFPSLNHSVTPQKKVIKYLNISSESISNTNNNKRLNSLINNYRKPTHTEPNHSLSKTTLSNKKTYSKITKKPLNRSTIINSKDYLDKKKIKSLKSIQNKNGNNVTITTSASNSNTFQKKYKEIIENIEGQFFGVLISKNEQTELNEFINQLSKKIDLNIVYISKDQMNGDYEKTINKLYINNLFNFVLYEQSYELLKKYSNKDFILFDKKENPLYSFCFDYNTNKTIIFKEISNIIHNKNSLNNNSEKFEGFFLSLLENNSNLRKHLLINDLTLLYFPEIIQKKEEQLRNDSMIIELYTFTNLYDKKVEVISISNNEKFYPWINYKFDNEMKYKVSTIPIKSPLLVFDHNYKLISSSGIKEILQNGYQSYRFWMNCSNVLNSFPNNNISSLSFTDHENNSIQNIPNRQFIMFNFYSSNVSESIIHELCSIYNCLKHKILFLHINYDEITSTNIEKAHPFNFGLYPSFDSEYLSSLFMKIQLNRTQRENPFILILSDDEIITYISYSSIKTSIYPLFNKWLSPYNFIHNKTVLYSFLSPIEKLITPQRSKISINEVNQFDLILLYFNELSNQKRYTNIVNELNIKLNSDKRNKVLIIFIPYDKNISLKTLQNANKDINFYQCEYNNINELYKRYNPMKKLPTMTLIDRFGTIINDNATSQIENQGEMYFKNIFEQLGIDYFKEPILINFSFLGDEFEYEGKRISRKSFDMKCKYVGLLFLSSWCIVSDPFTKEIDEINEKNKVVEIILNNIEEDKSIFNQFNKAMKYISIPYDYRTRLMDLFNIISIGVPSLFLFDIDNGNYIHYFDMENINTLKDFI